MFGEEDIIWKKKRSFSCICLSNEGEIIKLTKANFIDRLANIDFCNKKLLMNLVKKENLFNSIIKYLKKNFSNYKFFLQENRREILDEN